MTLTVTAGAADADSYISLADADAWHAAAGAAAWAAASEADREAALRRATRWIDARYRRRFPGVPTNGRAQALEWPRDGASDRYGSAVGSETIPAEIAQGTAVAALAELAEPFGLLPSAVAAETVSEVTAGPVSLKFGDAGSAASQKAPALPEVDGLLARLLTGGGASVRLMRG